MIVRGGRRARFASLGWTKPATLVLSLLALASCGKKAPNETTDGGVSAQSASPPVAVNAAPSPPPQTDSGIGVRLSTTSWNIAGGNLDADIADRTRRAKPDSENRLHLVELLLARAQYLASVEDYERADELAAKMVAEDPKSHHAHFGRALAHAALHRFDAALKALDEAAKLGAPAERVASSRASILIALGRYDEAEKLTPPVTDKGSPVALISAAVLAGRMQKHDESDRLFETARSRIVDVSPFLVAWMDFERGSLLEERGKEMQARAYHAEAVEKIPVYVHAAVHLATTDPPDQAIARLEELKKTSSDADILAALADAYGRVKNETEAKRVTDLARARYNALVAKHPEAYGDHAARFWLRAGNDPKKALELAEKNAQLRATEETIDLWMAAAAAAGRKEQICASAAAMKKLRWASEQRKRLAAAALNACPDAAAD